MRWWRDISLAWKLLGAFGAVSLIVGADGALALSSLSASQASVSWVEHTQEVKVSAYSLLTNLLDMQTGYRGFLLTGADAYLEGYTTGRTAYLARLADLEQLTADNPGQIQRWQDIGQQAALWQQTVTEPGIAYRRSLGTNASLDELAGYVQNTAGRQVFDAIRSLALGGIAVEQGLLDQRIAIQNAWTRQVEELLILGTALAVGISLAMALLLKSSIGDTVAKVAVAARQIAHNDLPTLVHAVCSVAAGDLGVHAAVTTESVPIGGADELGTMASDFNWMIARVHETYASLDDIVRSVATQRDMLNATLEAAQDAIAIVDTDLQPTVSNKRHRDWLGASADELRQLLPDARASAAFARVEHPDEFALWAIRLLHDRDAVETRRVRFVGAPLQEADCYTAPVRDHNGVSVGRVFVYHDVSREAELARLKDELVSVVSHELRTPLASLVGFAELLLARDYSEGERRKFLGIMVDEGRRLTALINDFLDLQRLESGRQQLSLTRTDLGPVLDRAVAALGADSSRPIYVDVPSELPLVRADPQRIHQLLINLLSNARKYSPEGGTVLVTARFSADVVEVAVQDEGLGIPASSLPELFGKFFRVDSSDRRAIKGTGLGLAVAKQIVEAHGGRIWAESSGPGMGARFVFTLPLADATSSAGDVLVVEDDSGFAQLLEAELAARGHTAVRVASAEAALSHMLTGRPHVLVLDLLLPGMRGEDFLQRLREDGRKRLPVVVVTVKDLDVVELRKLEGLGVVGVLRKGPGVAPTAADLVDRALQDESRKAA